MLALDWFQVTYSNWITDFFFTSNIWVRGYMSVDGGPYSNVKFMSNIQRGIWPMYHKFWYLTYNKIKPQWWSPVLIQRVDPPPLDYWVIQAPNQVSQEVSHLQNYHQTDKLRKHFMTHLTGLSWIRNWTVQDLVGNSWTCSIPYTKWWNILS